MNQLPLPVDVDVGATALTGSPLRCAGADGVLPTVTTGAVVSGAWAPAFGTAISAAPSAAAVATRLSNPLSPSMTRFRPAPQLKRGNGLLSTSACAEEHVDDQLVQSFV